MNSKTIVVEDLPQGKLFLTFVHTDNYTVIAEIWSDTCSGKIRLLRDTDIKWVPLEDTIDHSQIYGGFKPVNVAVAYQAYTVKLIVDE